MKKTRKKTSVSGLASAVNSKWPDLNLLHENIQFTEIPCIEESPLDNPLPFGGFVGDLDLSLSEDRKDEFLNSLILEQIRPNGHNSYRDIVISVPAKDFNEKYGKLFFNTINETEFESGEDNSATELFSKMLDEDKDAALKLLQDCFVRKFDDPVICVKLLTLLNDYSYEELHPYSQSVALASVSNKSSRVKSAALNMFAHWGNADALRLLNQMEPPTEPWIRMKYDSIKSTLEGKWSTPAK